MQLQPLIAKKVMCTCQIQTAVVFLFFFLCGSKHQAYKPPSFSQSSCWYRAVMSCSVSTVCIHETPSLSAASFDILAMQISARVKSHR